MNDTQSPTDLACIEVVELVTEYIEGALPVAEQRGLEAHLEQCDGCAEYLAQMRTVARLLGDLRAAADL
jgi:anti-sigma factor RsiW